MFTLKYITVQYFNIVIIFHHLQYGRSPLDIARQYGHHDVVDYLVTLGKFVMLINVYSSQYLVHSINVTECVCVCVCMCVHKTFTKLQVMPIATIDCISK